MSYPSIRRGGAASPSASPSSASAAAAREPEHVAIGAARAHDLLAFDRALDGTDPIAQPRRLLELLGLRGARHALAQQVDELRRTAAQEHRGAADEIGVGRGVDAPT